MTTVTGTSRTKAADPSSVLPAVRTVKAAVETLDALARRREVDAELNFTPAQGVGYRYNTRGEIDPNGTLTLTDLHTGPEQPVAEPLDRHVIEAEGGSIRHQERGFITRLGRLLTPNPYETARISRQSDERLHRHVQHALAVGLKQPRSFWGLKDQAHELPDGDLKRRYLNTIATREAQRDRWITTHRRDLVAAVVAAEMLDCRFRLRAQRALEEQDRARTLGQVADVRDRLRKVGRGDLAGKLGERTIVREILREELATRAGFDADNLEFATPGVGSVTVRADSPPSVWVAYLTRTVTDRLAYDPVWAATP